MIRTAAIAIVALAAGGASAEDAIETGAALYRQKGCVACHSIDGTRLTAPTLKGVWGREVRLRGGGRVIADEAYVRESIVNSGARIVEGFLPIMPNFKSVLQPAEVDALVAFVRSLGDPPPAP